MHDQGGEHVDLGDFLHHQVGADQPRAAAAVFAVDGQAQIAEFGQQMLVLLREFLVAVPASRLVLEPLLRQTSRGVAQFGLLIG